jgi:uncharacterized protein (DUF302 family)
MMFTVHRSELDFDETVARLKESAQEHGWEIPMTHDLQKRYQEAGYPDMTKVKTLYFCDPHGGYRILQDDVNKPMSVMMPMGVSIYETGDGQVYIAGMNLDRMSMMFGGVIKEVLREGAVNYAQSLEDIATPEAGEEIKVDQTRCCLGCLSLTAIAAAFVGVLVVIAAKVIPLIMPKMMAKMMPQMTAKMKKAGVQPPCAQIILEHLDTQQKE